MKFGPVPTARASGTILAHSLDAVGADGKSYRIRKGTRLTDTHAVDLTTAGHCSVTVAQLDTNDVHEDAAAQRLAQVLLASDDRGLDASRAHTGRVNIVATEPGVVTFDADAILAINLVDPMVTLATVPPFTRATPDMLVATIKIISFAVPKASLSRALDAVTRDAIRFHPPRLRSACLIETVTDDRDPSAKGYESLKLRLDRLGVTLGDRVVVPHEIDDVARALGAANADLLFILTGSATSDIADTAPAAVRAAGGQVDHYGMPVDPGNLLFLGQLAGRPVIGLPGCARAPALNGADWVLERVICGLPVGPRDIAAMGLGGLLKEIPTRPQPRRER